MDIILILASFLFEWQFKQEVWAETHCKIDSCYSQFMATFVWNAINSQNQGRICLKSNLCIWRFNEEFCKVYKSSFDQHNGVINVQCDEMSSVELAHFRILGIEKLSRIRHPSELNIFLPFCGIAVVLILIIIWMHEQIEELCRMNLVSNFRKKRMENSVSIVRFDDCDSCIMEVVSGSKERSNEALNQSIHNVMSNIQDPIIALGYQKLREDTLAKHRRSTSTNQIYVDELGFHVPKLIFETKIPVEMRGNRHRNPRKILKNKKYYKTKSHKASQALFSKSKNIENTILEPGTKTVRFKSNSNVFCCCAKSDTCVKKTNLPENKNAGFYRSKVPKVKINEKYNTIIQPNFGYKRSNPDNKIEEIQRNRRNDNNASGIRTCLKKTSRSNGGTSTLSMGNINRAFENEVTEIQTRVAKKLTFQFEAAKLPMEYTNRTNKKEVSNIPKIEVKEPSTQYESADVKTETSKRKKRKDTVITFPTSSIDSSDLGLNIFLRACKRIGPIQYG